MNMSDHNKDLLSRWLPLLVALLANLAMFSYGYGKLEQRLAPLETHVSTDTTEAAMRIFVTKAEWSMRNDTRDRELADVKASLAQVNAKLDRLLERSK